MRESKIGRLLTPVTADESSENYEVPLEIRCLACFQQSAGGQSTVTTYKQIPLRPGQFRSPAANARVLLIHPGHVYNSRMESGSDRAKWWRNRWLSVRVTAAVSLLYLPLIVAEATRKGDWWHVFTQEPVWSLIKLVVVLAVVFLLLWGPVEMFVALATRTSKQ